MILILKIILYMILTWNRMDNSDFDLESFLDGRFWFWFEIVLDMIIPSTVCLPSHHFLPTFFMKECYSCSVGRFTYICVSAVRTCTCRQHVLRWR